MHAGLKGFNMTFSNIGLGLLFSSLNMYFLAWHEGLELDSQKHIQSHQKRLQSNIQEPRPFVLYYFYIQAFTHVMFVHCGSVSNIFRFFHQIFHDLKLMILKVTLIAFKLLDSFVLAWLSWKLVNFIFE